MYVADASMHLSGPISSFTREVHSVGLLAVCTRPGERSHAFEDIATAPTLADCL